MFAPRLGLLPLFCLLPAGLSAQERSFPYELTRSDVTVASTGVLVAGFGLVLQSNAEDPTVAEIVRLDRSSVNRFDRGATWNWSQAWQDVSDWTRDGLAAAAGLVTFVRIAAGPRSPPWGPSSPRQRRSLWARRS